MSSYRDSFGSTADIDDDPDDLARDRQDEIEERLEHPERYGDEPIYDESLSVTK